MKLKLTTMLFGLLLAVGWTSNAFAQEATYEATLPNGAIVAQKVSKAPLQTQPVSLTKMAKPTNRAPRRVEALDMKSVTASEIQNWTYTWTDANNETHTSAFTEAATDPYQMYELLRQVYMDPRFPGPTYTSYSASDVRERKVYYGGIEGGWNIGLNSQIGDITITPNNDDIAFQSIEVRDGNQVITSWTSANGTTLPAGWTGTMSTASYWGTTYYRTTGSIVIPSSLLAGHNGVQVVINTRYYATIAILTRSISVNGSSQNISDSFTNHTWTINAQNTIAPDGTYDPNDEGYTALVVAVKDDATAADKTYNSYDTNNSISIFNNKDQIIDYFTRNVQFIKLLTDGLRIGSADDYSIGTVFNCDGTYNKFFFLSKGQSRQKDSEVLTLQNQYGLMGERAPFKEMFEEFSPTSGETGSQITDFYSKMMDGQVYNVVHDCASVIDNAHQFSMSGNEGTTAYGMTGLNFFIPDFRLKYWVDNEYYIKYTDGYNQGPYSVDGRTMNPYVDINGNRLRGRNGSYISVPSFCANFAQYNQLYAPKVGIYRITLEAEAVSVGEYGPGNMFNVTLTWVSSLNEMSGHEVPQTYTIYLVDEEGNLTALTAEGVTNPTGVTTVTYQVPQDEHSYTITYIIEGSPDDNEHPSFVAWSNLDDVVIPGYKDFMALVVDHYESDFIIHKENYVGNEGERNYYRNFLHVASDNEDNALTVERINAGENKFTLYRYDVSNEDVLYPVGELTFQDRHDNRNVQFGFTYDANNPQDILRPASDTQKYTLVAMGIPNQGDLRIKGNGDLVIQPNGYDVNFRSISVYSGNTRVAYWTAPNNLPNGWYLSPGSLWEDWSIDGTRTRYIDGGGYIYIPELLNQYDNLRVEINAFGDGSKIAKIAVNDISRTIANNNINYVETWNITSNALHAPNRAETTISWDFETEDDLDGWLVADNDGDGDYWFWNNGYGLKTHSGNGSMASASFDNDTGPLTPDNWLISPEVTLGGTLTLWACGQDASDNAEVFGVYALAAGGDTWYLVGDIITTTGTMTEYSFDLSEYEGQTGQFMIRHFNCTNQFLLLIDDISITRESGDDPTPDVGRMVRLGNLPIVDQFSAETKYNTHPSRYGYVLKYEPAEGEAKESSRAEVPVQHTGSVVNGYYTEQQVIEDTDRKLETDMLTADMQMTLSESNSAIFYYDIQGKLNDNPVEYQDYESQLQRQTNFTYIEMKPTSDVYGKTYNPGIHHYYDSVAVKGTYGEFKTYVPSVMTQGFDRRYYEYDGLNNTYGAPIWKTGVGKVENIVATAQRQDGAYGSTNWTDANGNDCSLYFLEVSATGVLPDYSNVEYEPYMYRVWIYSPTGKLRGYSQVLNPGTDPDNTGDAGSHLVDDPTADRFGPICVYEELNNTTSFYKPLSSTWAENICFGAVSMADATANEDLIVIVRFYFRSKGSSAGNSNMFRAEGDDETPMYNATESESSTNIATSVSEVRYSGEVVSQTFINVQGQMSDKPFDGVNIVVTRYSDGATSISKVVK